MQLRPALWQLGDLAHENFATGRIFIAHVDVDVRSLDYMRADQRALDEAMRISLEIIAVLEGSGLALVAIDGHQPGTGLAQHRAPFAPRWKAGPAEATQRRIIERLEQVFLLQFARTHAIQQLVAAAGDIGVVTDI